jgi:hypothetical protein
MLRHILAAALLAPALGCDAESMLAPAPASGASTVAWTDIRIGPATVQFPCKAAQLAPGQTRCTLPDGADFSLTVVGLKRSELDELQLVRAYVQGNPAAKLVQGDAFPVRWTESRWLHKEQHELLLVGGMEYLLTVSYSTAEPPAAAGEFFSRAKVR